MDQIALKYRIFVICVAISSYGLIVFQSNQDYSVYRIIDIVLYHLMIPAVALVSVGVIVPELMFKHWSTKRGAAKVADRATAGGRMDVAAATAGGTTMVALSGGSSTVLLDPPKHHPAAGGEKDASAKSRDNGMRNAGHRQEDSYPDDRADIRENFSDSLHDLDEGDSSVPEEDGMSSSKEEQASAAIRVVRETVEQKTKQMSEELALMKSEIKNIKDGMQQTTSLIENALIDIKAFQAEMVNPMNFMRKYFEAIDLKNLSDPTQALSQLEVAYNNNNNNNGDVSGNHDQHATSASKDVKSVENGHPEKLSDNSQAWASDDATGAGNEVSNELAPGDTGSFASPHDNVPTGANLRQVLGKKLTLGKMMSMVSMVEEILKSTEHTAGINILVEQCRMLGLKPEDEQVIYNIVGMLEDSRMTADTIITVLYKFGQALGLNDKDADLYYTKLLTNKTGNSNRKPRKRKKKMASSSRRTKSRGRGR
ncbi:MAG: hypothetical protein AB1351_00205 [Thermoproteota archaeon]